VRIAVPALALAAEALVLPPHLPGRVRLAAFVGVAAALGSTPGGAVAPAFVLLAALASLAHPVDVGWRTSLLVLLLHAVLALATLAEHIAWRARVEAAVLRGLARDAFPAQVTAQVLVLALAPFAAAESAHPWIRLLAVVAALGVALLARAVARPSRQ
jgi:hypothetical protein